MGKVEEHEPMYDAWTGADQAETPADVPRETCVWEQQDYEGGDCWETDCGDAFWLDNGTPDEQGMKFCCYCGKALEERLFVEEVEAEE